MPTQANTRIHDSFADAVSSEVVTANENLALWLDFLQERGGLDRLFRMEAWLKGIRCFLDVHHLPLSENEHAELVNRSFAPEIRVIRTALQVCEQSMTEVARIGQPPRLEFEAFSGQARALSGPEHHIGRLLEQPSPVDSLTRFMETLNDLRILAESVATGTRQDLQLYVALGRIYNKELRSCRFVDMLLGQRFRLQYDRVDNPVLSGVLRTITDDRLRRDVALALLYLLRLLKYLDMVGAELTADQPLRHCLVVFALLHQEAGNLADFLRSRFLKRSDNGTSLRSAVEFVLCALEAESQRAVQRELIFVAREADAAPIYARIENSHGLLHQCYQSCIIALVQAFERALEPKALFPSMLESQQRAVRLHQELWDLRDYMKQTLENKGNLDLVRIVARLALFRESSMRNLLYRDWGGFEQLSDLLVGCGSQVEIRSTLRKLVAFVESLVQEVSKRSVMKAV